MDARLGTVALPRARTNSSLAWTIAAVEGIILLALAAGMLARLGGGTSAIVPELRPRALAHAGAVQAVGAQAVSYGITGTGLGLARVAGLTPYGVVALLYGTPATRGFVTGTGPGLVELGGGMHSRSAPVVTGTGPGLIQIAGQQR